jgi:hypothetical protein
MDLLDAQQNYKSFNGSYNSLTHQVGYCKMQSFDTVSRSSSGSVPMFVDGRVSFGVGISNENMRLSAGFLCGACLKVTKIENFYEWNYQITEWYYDKPSTKPFVVMVMDQCTDPVCTTNYLDFDVYNEKQPVRNGNPFGVVWEYIPCPLLQGETMEYLLCFASSCHVQDPETTLTLGDILQNTFTVTYWSLTIRNFRVPISKVLVRSNDSNNGPVNDSDSNLIPLRLENSWVWDQGLYDLEQGISILMVDVEGKTTVDYIEPLSLSTSTSTTPGYRGGISLKSRSAQN